jgi:hypothetical protein
MSEAYRDMCARLLECKRHRDRTSESKEHLGASLEALRAVLLYLRADPLVDGAGLTEPLADLASAANDALRGAKPALFAHAHEPGGGGTRPKYLTAHTFQGTLAWYVEALASRKIGGRKPAVAAQFVADKARQIGIRSADGSEISAKRLLGWRAEIKGGRGPVGARQAFDCAKQVAGGEHLIYPKDDLAQARLERLIIDQMENLAAAFGSHSAPHAARKK